MFLMRVAIKLIIRTIIIGIFLLLITSNSAYSLTKAISAGANHTCDVTVAGEVRCWGFNEYGQLGKGWTVSSSPSPVSVDGLAGEVVASIATGKEHNCLLSGAGVVKCWGRNNYGQLGVALYSYYSSSIPITVSGLNDETVTAIAAGYFHTCVLTSAGAVKCWGRNVDGQLGNGISGYNQFSVMPVDVVDLAGEIVTAISAGSNHTCALISTGAVKCWGAGPIGGLYNQQSSKTPVIVAGLDGIFITAISAGDKHNCAVSDSGNAFCWGSNLLGQLGNGTVSSSYYPVAVVGLNGQVITAIKAGSSHTCALTSAGTVKCWGYNDFGELGVDHTGSSTTPLDVNGLADVVVTAITVGKEHTCALTTTSLVRCWGRNNFGQLGSGTNSDSSFPVAIFEGDTDSDSIPDWTDNCPSDFNSDQSDLDDDGQGDSCDSTANGDADYDGIDNSADNCPYHRNLYQFDYDQDSEGDECDTDLDGDGSLNDIDNCPLVENIDQLNTDSDEWGNVCDDDDDHDGYVDNADNCPLISNPDQASSDDDGQGNACDSDDDNDGFADNLDIFPLNSSESADSDADGIGNNSDNCPNLANADQKDYDGDYIGNACDETPYLTKTFYSWSSRDGWILESSENSSKGGWIESAGTTIRVGDSATDRQYRSFVYFDTASLPNNAVITKATLSLRRSSYIVTTTGLGALLGDIRSGYFGSTNYLAASDFEYPSQKSSAFTLSKVSGSTVYKGDLISSALKYVSKTSSTEIKLRFNTGDNDDLGEDTLRFYSGNYFNKDYWPTLTVEYYVP